MEPIFARYTGSWTTLCFRWSRPLYPPRSSRLPGTLSRNRLFAKEMSVMRWRSVLAGLIPAAVAVAGLSSSYMLPLEHDAIQYTTGAVNDPVAGLQKRIDAGAGELQYEEEFGYLRSVLRELKV